MFRNLFFTILIFPAVVHAQSFNPATEALRQFKAYQPKIEAAEYATVQPPTTVVGDLNGDGRPDCLVFFILTPKTGGNAIVGRATAVYLNTGKGMKVDGEFPEYGTCYVPEAIEKNGLIRMGLYKCVPPYNEREDTWYYRWQHKQLISVKRK